jgi:hypothetical protein
VRCLHDLHTPLDATRELETGRSARVGKNMGWPGHRLGANPARPRAEAHPAHALQSPSAETPSSGPVFDAGSKPATSLRRVCCAGQRNGWGLDDRGQSALATGGTPATYRERRRPARCPQRSAAGVRARATHRCACAGGDRCSRVARWGLPGPVSNAGGGRHPAGAHGLQWCNA